MPRYSRRLQLEALEPRHLLSLTINLFSVPTVTIVSDPTNITAGPDGNLWFTNSGSNMIGQINPTTHAFAQFPIPTPFSDPIDITTGPDGNLWFTEAIGRNIGRISSTTHVITEFPIPSAYTYVQLFGITSGPDSALWFTDFFGRIGRIDPTTYAITVFNVLEPTSGFSSITTGPDENLWFIDADRNKIGQFNPATHAITEFAIPTIASVPYGITTGPDGNLWFSEYYGNKIGQFNPATHAITEFAIPTSYSFPRSITTGPDGNIWFTEQYGGNLGRINPITHAITEYPVPKAMSQPFGITTGPDGNIWFAEFYFGNIGQAVILANTTTELSAAPSPSSPGQPVTFTAEITRQTGSGTPLGTVTFSIDGVAQAPIPLAMVGGADLARFSTMSLSAGSHTVTATYNPLGNFTASTSNTLTQIVADGPSILSVQRLGFHSQPTTLLLIFNQPLDPITAQNPLAYRILDPHNQRVAISSAVYNPTTLAVTLTTSHRLNLHHQYLLIASGTGPYAIRNPLGLPLDGAKSGRPGSDYATQISAANWVRPLHRKFPTHRR